MSVQPTGVALSTSKHTSLSKTILLKFIINSVAPLLLCGWFLNVSFVVGQETEQEQAVQDLLKNGLPDDLPALKSDDEPRKKKRRTRRSRNDKAAEGQRDQNPVAEVDLPPAAGNAEPNVPVFQNRETIKKALEGLGDEVPVAARKKLETEIIPSLIADNDMAFIVATGELVTNFDPKVVALIEKHCEAKQFGSLKQQFTERLVSAVMQGLRPNVRGFAPELVDFASSGMLDVVESELGDFKLHRVNDDPLALPADWKDNEKLFWDLHVWRNRFENIKQLVSYAKQIQKPLLDKAVELDHDDKIDRYRQPFLVEKQVNSQYRNLIEREAELRIAALGKAEEVLRTSDVTFERLNAAFALEMHCGELELFFREHKDQELEREKLQEANISEQCEVLIASGRKHGKKILEKAMLLRIGAHWWMRGRYGASSMVKGLLKPPAAMNQEAAMFGLFMPKDRPNAIGYVDSESGEETSGYDRRHYYTWGVERQDVVRAVKYNSNPSTAGKEYNSHSSKTFY